MTAKKKKVSEKKIFFSSKKKSVLTLTFSPTFEQYLSYSIFITKKTTNQNPDNLCVKGKEDE
jgi:hypothetical protein